MIGGDVLDVGAGDQPYRRHFPGASRYIATNTPRFYAGRELERVGSRTQVWTEDATALPFRAASFDSIVCFQVLSAVRKPGEFFHEAARLLRPGGVLMLTTDFLYPQWSAGDVMRHTEKHLAAMATDAAFEVEVLESFGGIYTTMQCCLERYIRTYPQRVRAAAGGGARAARAAALFLYLLLTPLVGLAGRLVYLLERDRSEEFDYTVNTLIVCRRK